MLVRRFGDLANTYDGNSLVGTFGGSGKAVCKKTDFRFIVGGGTWYPPSKQSKCGCTAPVYVVEAGLPSFDHANMTLYLAGDHHPRLSFDFGQTMEVHYEPSVSHDEVVRYSRLQNLTVGDRVLMVHGNATEGSDHFLGLLNDGGDEFQILLDRAFFRTNATLRSVVVQMTAEFSHLVSHPDSLIPQRQVESKAAVAFNVSDASILRSVLGTPAVLGTKRPAEIPLVAPHYADQLPLILSKLEQLTHITLPEKQKARLRGLTDTDLSLRELILIVLLGLVCFVFALRTPLRA
ncbi:uncharacterized protein EI97DRAFT_200740 [Westerdykella ornata]|uniref:Uncharacterized protein n=1 Tax=Westerdykella ornata TaxID=318751 RepID=A0A6A6J9A3_WESOR|nr:uncharacterized protein EI97DRAFT_200740 [Westerdykella ornata]KAF2272774.1 hypothetical protein EI97DRAFT_200740 [Westerdykella ornata]